MSHKTINCHWTLYPFSFFTFFPKKNDTIFITFSYQFTHTFFLLILRALPFLLRNREKFFIFFLFDICVNCNETLVTYTWLFSKTNINYFIKKIHIYVWYHISIKPKTYQRNQYKSNTKILLQRIVLLCFLS